MSLLKDVGIGDTLFLFDVNRKGRREAVVTKVAHKYLTVASGERFNIETGYGDSKSWPTHYWARTGDQVARQEAWDTARALAKDVNDKMTGYFRSDRFSDEEVATITKLLQQIRQHWDPA